MKFLDLHRVNRLARVVDDAFISNAGASALDLLGDLAFERGQPVEARRWWQLLAWGILVVLLVWPPFAAREAPPEIGQRGLGEGAYSDWRGGSKA